MKETLAKMEAQLARDRSKIDRLAEVSQMIEAESSIDALVYIDELKALHATAQSALDRLKAGGETDAPAMELELNATFNDLRAALDDLML